LDTVELYCTQDNDGQWLVWFPHPLGGIKVLKTFYHEADARAFLKEQIDNADWEAE
jgi:hypothetical protein